MRLTDVVQLRQLTQAQLLDLARLLTPAGRTSCGPHVYGLVGMNDPGAPNTRFLFFPEMISVFSPGQDTSHLIARPGGTNDISVAGVGPGVGTANGRDQVAAFTNSQFVDFYFCWNPTTGGLATLSSQTAFSHGFTIQYLPSGISYWGAGPAFPTGYTHFAYVGSVWLDGAGNLVPTRFAGSWAFNNGARNALNSVAITIVETALNLAAFVPLNALEVQIQTWGWLTQVAGAGNLNNGFRVRVVTGLNFDGQPTAADNTGLGSVGYHIIGKSIRLPNIGQQLFYKWDGNAFIGAAAYGIDVQGYKMPNGGE